MFHQPIQERHAVKHGNKWGVLKIFLDANAARQMMHELPKGSVREGWDRVVWVPYPDVTYVTVPALTYQVDTEGVCYATD